MTSIEDSSTSHKTDTENTTNGERLLEGKSVNLRIVEKEDLPLAAEWLNNLGFWGEYNPLMQMSKADLQKWYDNLAPEERWFFIEKKDGTKVGIRTGSAG